MPRPPRWAHRRPWGLRGRLTRLFALVAVLAVGLTSFVTAGAGFQIIAGLLAPQVGTTAQAPGPGFPRDFWQRLTPAQRDTYLQEARMARRVLTRAGFSSALLSALLAVGVAAAATRSLTRPLGRLVDGARRLERGERGWRLPVPRHHDELRDLTLAFNVSLDSLERQEAWRRALVADVAHDLRTPLAVLRAEVEAMQDGVTTPDAAGLARLHGEVLLLSRLVDDLRTLTLAEGGALSLHPERLDAAALLRQVTDAFAARVTTTGHTLNLRLDTEPLWLNADRARLQQVLHQLIDNALRHTPPGVIELRGAQDASSVRLAVRDHGPGLSDEARSRAFERFYRADASRQRDPDGRAGSGLGLAIVRALVEAQGGQVDAANAPDGGAIFTLHFPAH